MIYSNLPYISDCHVYSYLTGEGGYQSSLTSPVSLNKRASFVICHNLLHFIQCMIQKKKTYQHQRRSDKRRNQRFLHSQNCTPLDTHRLWWQRGRGILKFEQPLPNLKENKSKVKVAISDSWKQCFFGYPERVRRPFHLVLALSHSITFSFLPEWVDMMVLKSISE